MGGKEEESDQPWKGRDRAPIPGFVLLGIFGAAAATAASGRWRRPVEWFYNQLWRSGYYFRYGSGFRSSGTRNEHAWSRYRRRIQEMEEDERERVERIRRMQEVFSRERNRRRKGPEVWTNHGGAGGWHQDFSRDDWYYKTESRDDNQRTKHRSAASKQTSSARSHHYTVLGLDRYRAEPYSDAEIKSAFRKKALEFHPDRNRNNSATAEAKFKEVVASYDAIKLERKRGSC